MTKKQETITITREMQTIIDTMMFDDLVAANITEAVEVALSEWQANHA